MIPATSRSTLRPRLSVAQAIMRAVKRPAWIVALGLLVVAPTPRVDALDAAETSPLDGREIVSIVVIRDEIFDTTDPATDSWPYRWANALHITTRERFIRSMLLFGEGEPYSAARAAESARILRSLDFLNPVDITAQEVEGGVEVTVRTHDLWTLEVGAKFGLFGDRTETQVQFEENNFLGWGRTVLLEYRDDNERTSLRYGYFDPNVFGTRWQAKLRYDDTSDGERHEVRVERPFYALATPRAWGGAWLKLRQDDYLYSGGDQIVRGAVDRETAQAWFGWRLPTGTDTVHRLQFGWDAQDHAYSDWRYVADQSPYPTPEDRTISGPRIGYQRRVDDFVVLRGMRGWSTQEDLALATQVDAGLTVSTSAFGGDRQRLLVDARVSDSWRLDGWVLQGALWASGRVEDAGVRNAWIGGQIAAFQLGDRGWQARLSVETTHEPDLDVQLTLGADTGLRGWNPDTFDGTGRAILNVQWRTLLKEEFLNLFSVGLVVFADGGHTWAPRVGPGTERVRGDVGLGLLADLTHIGLANVLRFEAALPDDGSGPVFTVTGSALF